MAYVRLLCSHALGETKKHWTPQRVWVAFASPVITVPLRGLFYGWTVQDLGFTVAITLLAVAVGWGLTFLFELTRAPALIHNQQQIAIQTLSKPRTASEDHHFHLAIAGLDQIGQRGLIVLRHLWNHGTLTFAADPPSLPSGMSMSDTLDLLVAAESQQLVAHKRVGYSGGWEDIFEIAPGMKDALKVLLFRE